MFKDKIIDIIHKEEDLIRHKLEDLEESQIIRDEIQFGMGPADRESLAKKRETERKEHQKEIDKKREQHHQKIEAKRESKKHEQDHDHLNDDIIFDKFMANNRL